MFAVVVCCPVILIGTDVLNDKMAATVFGALVLVAGMIGNLFDAAPKPTFDSSWPSLAWCSGALAFVAWLVDLALVFLVCMFFSLFIKWRSSSASSRRVCHGPRALPHAPSWGRSIAHHPWLTQDCGSVIDHDHIERLERVWVHRGSEAYSVVWQYSKAPSQDEQGPYEYAYVGFNHNERSNGRKLHFIVWCVVPVICRYRWSQSVQLGFEFNGTEKTQRNPTTLGKIKPRNDLSLFFLPLTDGTVEHLHLFCMSFGLPLLLSES
ncbi:Aste57867_1227 [Aphanomyces stellatus]|uniref:Aste57867_1227 protein n=1 Tax=Aphanomyces stellatus TaxID=120398 RepID=A0A485K7C8_9STRA|nr:hypothetical protein As57867_001226 [Aphanomyces stellatus]VFT78447.1 Aste57867_1227 [Aphanomyces stellatus]